MSTTASSSGIFSNSDLLILLELRIQSRIQTFVSTWAYSGQQALVVAVVTVVAVVVAFTVVAVVTVVTLVAVVTVDAVVAVVAVVTVVAVVAVVTVVAVVAVVTATEVVLVDSDILPQFWSSSPILSA